MAKARRKEALVFRPVTPSRWSDMEELFGERGACSGCWCMWWRLARSEFNRRTGSQRKQMLKRLVENDTVPGILAYFDGQPIGWCSIAPREQYKALEQSRTLRRIDNQPVWSVVCFFMAKPFRRKGLMRRLLRAATEYAASHGARIVEGYPVNARDVTLAGSEGFTGLIPAFRDVGFEEVARPSERVSIMRFSI